MSSDTNLETVLTVCDGIHMHQRYIAQSKYLYVMWWRVHIHVAVTNAMHSLYDVITEKRVTRGSHKNDPTVTDNIDYAHGQSVIGAWRLFSK